MYSSEAQERRMQRAVMLMVSATAFANALMLSAANVALPDIARELKVDAVLLNWIPLAYLTAGAMLVLCFGRLADMVGRKKILLGGTMAVIVTSVLAATATNATSLIVFRLLQGAGAATSLVAFISIVSSAIPVQSRGRGFGLVASTVYFGLSVGPLIAGFVIDLVGWRWAFVMHLPFALIGLYVGVWVVRVDWKAQRPGRFDFQGAIVYALAILGVANGIAMLPAANASLFLLAAGLGLLLFVNIELRVDDPLFNVRLFRSHPLFTLSCAAALLMYAASFSTLGLISLYFQYVRSMNAQTTGLLLMAQPVTIALFARHAGSLADRFELRILASIGIGTTGVGLIMLSLLGEFTSIPYIVASLVISGYGFCLFAPVNASAVMSSVEPIHFGTASAGHASFKVIGQMISMAVVTLIFGSLIGRVQIGADNFDSLQRSISLSFASTAALCVPAVVISASRGNIHGND
ncbi:MAG: MFS transporter [Proteobacteria bacterium]|nr:MFS transporter [Pseudomonadota bacterium]